MNCIEVSRTKVYEVGYYDIPEEEEASPLFMFIAIPGIEHERDRMVRNLHWDVEQWRKRNSITLNEKVCISLDEYTTHEQILTSTGRAEYITVYHCTYRIVRPPSKVVSDA